MNVKKVGLVTCYFQPNYGSQLQAYATQLIFDKMNVANETICIDGLRSEINKAKYWYFLSRIGNINIVRDKLTIINKAFASKMRGKEYRENIAIRANMFTAFSQRMFHVSEVFHSKMELSEKTRNYSAFVLGSDQLWLPSNIAADYYTLNFVPDEIPKIALATSFGVSELPIRQAKLASKFLRRIDFCSVRETSGQKLVKDLSDRNVPIVCDPTILFTADEWNDIVSSERFYHEKYILCYFLGNNPEQRELVSKIKRETGYKIVQLQHCDEFISTDINFPDYAPYNVGPAEFVQLIRDAEIVCTDSFHASVFSLLFQKKFFTFRRYNNDGRVSTNGRLYSLLSLVGLEERLLSSNEHASEILKMSINYKTVHTDLAKLRRFTKKYIEEALRESGIHYDNY